jgi:hypothetical protein
MGWDETQAGLPRLTCAVCGKEWFMSRPICAPCSWWAKKVEEMYAAIASRK